MVVRQYIQSWRVDGILRLRRVRRVQYHNGAARKEIRVRRQKGSRRRVLLAIVQRPLRLGRYDWPR